MGGRRQEVQGDAAASDMRDISYGKGCVRDAHGLHLTLLTGAVSVYFCPDRYYYIIRDGTMDDIDERELLPIVPIIHPPDCQHCR